MNFKEFLISINACDEAREWVGDKTIKEAWEQCERGDWMLWLFRRADNFDKRSSTLAKGHCANTVRHLMKDGRSIAGVDAAISYGNGDIDDNQLSAAADAAAAAYAAAAYAAYATDAAAAAYAAYAAAADAYAAYAAAARIKNRKETADICRRYLPMPIHSDVA
jgi:hypothetical protein